ncbi:hypothetical protein BDZ97DRAFT_1809379 [Flammula alnicola]|nr:hypothetical protein BDZ97DRAFT_1809379 [Flammula alnicola]
MHRLASPIVLVVILLTLTVCGASALAPPHRQHIKVLHRKSFRFGHPVQTKSSNPLPEQVVHDDSDESHNRPDDQHGNGADAEEYIDQFDRDFRLGREAMSRMRPILLKQRRREQVYRTIKEAADAKDHEERREVRDT